MDINIKRFVDIDIRYHVANTVSSIGVGAILVATFNLVSSLVMLGLGFEGVRK